MIERKKYDKVFYDSQSQGSYNSALEILPMIREWLNPSSVLDVGCGIGTWLRVWKDELGVKDIVGIDGDYVKREFLQIDPAQFISKDLKEPFSLNRKFDLVMSLEVGEHLPADKSAMFIDNLVRHGNIIIFSAAIPNQRGTYHINEQLTEFWAELFIARGYIPVDVIRDKIWINNKVEWWYRQNIILYIDKNTIEQYPVFLERSKHTNPESLTRIHPLLWQYRNEENEIRSHWISFLKWKLSSIKKIFSTDQ